MQIALLAMITRVFVFAMMLNTPNVAIYSRVHVALLAPYTWVQIASDKKTVCPRKQGQRCGVAES